MNNDNLPLYTAFLAVVRAGSILEASRQLYISQPAVSKAVHKLETNLGTTLFIRSSRGIQLTESGYILYENIKMHLNISKPEKMVSHRTTVHRPVISASAPAQHYANIYCFHTLENIQHRIRRLISQLNVSQAMTQ